MNVRKAQYIATLLLAGNLASSVLAEVPNTADMSKKQKT